MATPTSNFVITTAVNPLSAGLGRYLLSGDKWGAALGQGVTLNYSFPTATAYHATPYGAYYNAGEWLGYTALSLIEKAAVRSGLAVWSAVANIRFVETTDTASNVGELRFAKTSYDTAYEYAHAYLPGNDPAAGDVWFSTANWHTTAAASITAGSDDFHTIVHELGHALGLKHSFETPYAIPAQFDSYFYTVMSYSARVSGDSGTASFYPTTPMYYDLVAIQALYGRNTAHNATNTTYAFAEGRTYFQTIDDAGGIDGITYTGTSAVTIDLNQGRFSSLSAPITFDGGVKSRATVAIGPSTIIENATGGSGSDVLVGNTSGNVLSGLNGNDTIYGNGGNDTLSGGYGNDKLFGGIGNDVLTGGANNDTFYFQTALNATSNADRMTDFNAVADQIYIDNAVFSRFAAGSLNLAYFVTGTAAQDSNDYIIYNKTSGILSYDADGSGAAAAVKFAILLPNTVVTAADIVIY